MGIDRVDIIADNEIDYQIDNQLEKIIFTSHGPMVHSETRPPRVPASVNNQWLKVYNSDGSLFNTYTNLTNVTVSNMDNNSCNSVGLSAGRSVTNLVFSHCATGGNFSIVNTPNLISLTSLSFQYCAYDGSVSFSIDDTSGLGSVTSLSFYYCGYDVFGLNNTEGLSSLTSLSFQTCAYYDFYLDTTGMVSLTNLNLYSCAPYGEFYFQDTSDLISLTTLNFNGCGMATIFDFPDTSGLTALTTLSFTNCGHQLFSLPNTSGLENLTSLSFSYCGYDDYLIDFSGFSSLETLTFGYCFNYTPFVLDDTTSLTSLNSLSFNHVSIVDNIEITDTSGLTSLNSLSFSNCAGQDVIFSDTSGLTALTSLSFEYCAGDGFYLTDTSGLTSVTSLSFSYCGYGSFILPITSGAVGYLDSLTNLYIHTPSYVDKTSILLILDALFNGINNNGQISIYPTVYLDSGDNTEPLETLISRGWTIEGIELALVNLVVNNFPGGEGPYSNNYGDIPYNQLLSTLNNLIASGYPELDIVITGYNETNYLNNSIKNSLLAMICISYTYSINGTSNYFDLEC